jgi:Uma2 family endonuclease
MSPEEFDAIEDYDECYRYELIRGVVIVSPMAGESQDDPNEELGRFLRNFREAYPQLLDKTLAERYLYLPDGSRRRPDRVIWCGLGRLPRPKQDVPAIVIEFVSRRRRDWRRDYVDKRAEYQAHGVREYWVIDRYRRQMTVFFLDGTERLVAETETYESPLLPGFQLPLARLLAISDEWSEEDEADADE